MESSVDLAHSCVKEKNLFAQEKGLISSDKFSEQWMRRIQWMGWRTKSPRTHLLFLDCRGLSNFVFICRS